MHNMFPAFSDNYQHAKEESIIKIINNLKFSEHQNHLKFFKQLVQKDSSINKLKTILVAGTNGKGEVSYLTSFFLIKSGYNVATWSSPHIMTIKERFCYNGIFAEYEEVKKLILEYADFSNQLNYYEFLFFIFLKYIKNKRIDYLLLEVGVGGRLDSVNSFSPIISIITSISRDHQKILGNTYASILKEKMGICRDGIDLVHGCQSDYLKKKINLRKKTLVHSIKNNSQNNNDYDYSEINFKITSKVLELLKIDISTLTAPNNLWGRRTKITYNNIDFLFIGAHNIDGARSLAKYIKQNTLYFDKCLFAFSEKSIPELQKIIYSLFNLKDNISKYYYCKFKGFKSYNDNLQLIIQNQKCEILDDWKTSLLSKPKQTDTKKMQEKSEKILVTGSYYFFSQILSFIFSN